MYEDFYQQLPSNDVTQYMAKAYTPYPLQLGGVLGFHAIYDNIAHTILAEDREHANFEQ
jgi:hypothetical protein